MRLWVFAALLPALGVAWLAPPAPRVGARRPAAVAPALRAAGGEASGDGEGGDRLDELDDDGDYTPEDVLARLDPSDPLAGMTPEEVGATQVDERNWLEDPRWTQEKPVRRTQKAERLHAAQKLRQHPYFDEAWWARMHDDSIDWDNMSEEEWLEVRGKRFGLFRLDYYCVITPTALPLAFPHARCGPTGRRTLMTSSCSTRASASATCPTRTRPRRAARARMHASPRAARRANGRQ